MMTCAATADRDRVRLLDLEVAVGLTEARVREVFKSILPDDVLLPANRAAGLQERERKMNAPLFLRSMIISASTGYGGRQADAMKICFESGAKKVVRGPCTPARHGVHYVIRLKENWKPKVDHVARSSVRGVLLPGLDLDLLLDFEILALDGKVIDADVRVGSGPREVRCRLVGVPTDKGYAFFLTSLPPRIAPRSVAGHGCGVDSVPRKASGFCGQPLGPSRTCSGRSCAPSFRSSRLPTPCTLRHSVPRGRRRGPPRIQETS
jgi:hypothetical protein